MNEPNWLIKQLILDLHEMLLEEFGGSSGIRDEEMFESALSRPVNQFHYESSTIPELAAAYTFGIIKNHPFVDGNKRTAYLAGVTFLEHNGYKFYASEVDAIVQTLALAASELDEKGYANWLAEHSSVKR